jgi:hypothetical protein
LDGLGFEKEGDFRADMTAPPVISGYCINLHDGSQEQSTSVRGYKISLAGTAVVSQFDVAAALRRHLARETRRYDLKLRHCPYITILDSLSAAISLQAKLAVRAEAHQFHTGGIRLSVDENQVGPEVTIPKIAPRP